MKIKEHLINQYKKEHKDVIEIIAFGSYHSNTRFSFNTFGGIDKINRYEIGDYLGGQKVFTYISKNEIWYKEQPSYETYLDYELIFDKFPTWEKLIVLNVNNYELEIDLQKDTLKVSFYKFQKIYNLLDLEYFEKEKIEFMNKYYPTEKTLANLQLSELDIIKEIPYYIKQAVYEIKSK